MIELTEEECYYLYHYVLKTTFLDRRFYSVLSKIVRKIESGISEDYKPTREEEFKE